MPRNFDFKNSGKHPRLIEFEESKFYSKDFESKFMTFVNVYSLDDVEAPLFEFAHLCKNCPQNYWVTPENEVLTCGELIETLVEACTICQDLYIDIYTNDIFKPNPSLTVKRIFRYQMTMTDKTKKVKGGNARKGGIEKLYNLKPVSDMTSTYNLRQALEFL